MAWISMKFKLDGGNSKKGTFRISRERLEQKSESRPSSATTGELIITGGMGLYCLIRAKPSSLQSACISRSNPSRYRSFAGPTRLGRSQR